MGGGRRRKKLGGIGWDSICCDSACERGVLGGEGGKNMLKSFGDGVDFADEYGVGLGEGLEDSGKI